MTPIYCARLAKKLNVLDLARMVGHKDLRQLQVYYNETAETMAARLDEELRLANRTVIHIVMTSSPISHAK